MLLILKHICSDFSFSFFSEPIKELTTYFSASKTAKEQLEIRSSAPKSVSKIYLLYLRLQSRQNTVRA